MLSVYCVFILVVLYSIPSFLLICYAKICYDNKHSQMRFPLDT